MATRRYTEPLHVMCETGTRAEIEPIADMSRMNISDFVRAAIKEKLVREIAARSAVRAAACEYHGGGHEHG